MIGKSLSFCIQDIIKESISLDDVEKIICGTVCPTMERFMYLIDEYQSGYWRKFPNEAKRIAIQLWNDGKIDQPRLRGEPGPNIADRKIWIDA